MKTSRYARKPLAGTRLVIPMLALCGGLFFAAPTLADASMFPPQTNIRLTVVQWMSNKGVYERWDALGGDFQVSDAGTISLPIIGTIPVGKLDATGLSAEIGARLKAKIGLVETPAITISIIDYPPVFVVGDVKAPGEYKFRMGMTVLQSLAMSGGQMRMDSGAAKDKSEIVGTLRGYDNSILRSEIRIARLSAEASGAKEMLFDPEPGLDAQAAAAIFRQEKIIFVARANLMERQIKSFAELRDLLAREIENLGKKSTGADADIASVEKDLRNVKAMVEKGIALPSRQGDLERMLRSYYAGRLDLSTAVMRARQSISEASRNIEGIRDRHQDDVAVELQSEQSNLDQLKLKRETTQRQLLDALSQTTESTAADQGDQLSFTVNRNVNGTVTQIAASENTVLQPGDVVRVARQANEAGAATPAMASSSIAPDMQAETSQ